MCCQWDLMQAMHWDVWIIIYGMRGACRVLEECMSLLWRSSGKSSWGRALVDLLVECINQSAISATGYWEPHSSFCELFSLLPAFSCPQVIQPWWSPQWSGWVETEVGPLDSIPQAQGNWILITLSLSPMGGINALEDG